MFSFFKNLTVKTAVKSLICDEVTDKTKLAAFYGSQCITTTTAISRRSLLYFIWLYLVYTDYG